MEEDRVKNFEHLKELAEQNHPDILKALGDCYYSGDGCEADVKEGEKFWRLAAQMGSGAAYLSLGALYESRGEDKEKVARCYYEGCRRGDLECLFLYSLSLIKGGDTSTAVELMTFGANEGNRHCAVYLRDYYNELGDKQESEYYDKIAKKTDEEEEEE